MAKPTGCRRQPSAASSTVSSPGALFAFRRSADAGKLTLLRLVFTQFGISGEQLTTGLQQISRYLLRMFVWHDFFNWPFAYYFTQIGITLAIVFVGTLTATVIALLLSFLAARNIMRG